MNDLTQFEDERDEPFALNDHVYQHTAVVLPDEGETIEGAGVAYDDEGNVVLIVRVNDTPHWRQFRRGVLIAESHPS